MGTSPRSIGTPVRCPSCRHQNLAIDIWCERCGRPLDWKKDEAAGAATRHEAPVIQARPQPPLAPDPVPAPTKAPPPTPLGAVRETVAEQRSASKVYCWSCGTGNAAGDRYCGRCGAALTGRPGATAAKRQALKKPSIGLPKLTLPALALPKLTLPKLAAPSLGTPTLRMPRAALSGISAPRLSRSTWVAAAIVLVLLLLVPVVILLDPAKGG